METPRKSLVTKLAEVMGEVGHIPKSGENKFHNYKYATEADIVAAVRMGMSARGVMMFSSIEKVEWTELPGGKQRVATITVRFRFMDGDSDAVVEFLGVGQGADATDKAVYKAFTGAEKYALLKTFLIPTGDDPEKDDTPPPQRQRAPTKAPPLPTPAQVHAAAGKVAAAKLSPMQRIQAAATRVHYDEAALRDVMKNVHPGKKPSELTDADADKAVAYIDALNNPPEQGRDSSGGAQGVASPLGNQPSSH